MRIVETKNEFIKFDEKEKIPKGWKVYRLQFPLMYDYYERISIMSLPQYDLSFKSYGCYPFENCLELNYRSITIHPSFGDKNKEDGILDLLNDLKKGDYQNKMILYFEEYYKDSKSDFQSIEGILKNSHYKLDLKINKLKNEIRERKNEISSLDLLIIHIKLKLWNIMKHVMIQEN